MMRVDTAPQWGTLPKDPPRKTRYEVRDHYRGPLNVSSPVVEDEELRKKWHGMPPSKPKIARREGGPVSF